MLTLKSCENKGHLPRSGVHIRLELEKMRKKCYHMQILHLQFLHLRIYEFNRVAFRSLFYFLLCYKFSLFACKCNLIWQKRDHFYCRRLIKQVKYAYSKEPNKRSCTILNSHYSKSQIFVQNFNLDKTPTFSRVFHPNFF